MGGGWGQGDGRAVFLIPSIFDPCWLAVPRTSEQLLKPCKHVSTWAKTEGQLGLGNPGSGTLKDSSWTVQDFLM